MAQSKPQHKGEVPEVFRLVDNNQDGSVDLIMASNGVMGLPDFSLTLNHVDALRRVCFYFGLLCMSLCCAVRVWVGVSVAPCLGNLVFVKTHSHNGSSFHFVFLRFCKALHALIAKPQQKGLWLTGLSSRMCCLS